MAKRAAALPAGVICALALASCGLEDVPYIGQLPEPWRSSFDGADISLHIADGIAHFDNFAIFYRIYLSDRHIFDTANRALINPTMQADYNFFLPWTTGATAGTDVMNAFINRGFRRLALESAAINDVLGSASLGGALAIFFEQIPYQPPRLELDGASHALRRAQIARPGIDDFNPLPNINGALPFLNHDQLLNPANITSTVNADVVNRTGAGVSPGNVRSSYVMMYIFAEGLSFASLPPARVFSRPTFLGVFMLPPAL